jgi:hypothetical protein
MFVGINTIFDIMDVFLIEQWIKYSTVSFTIHVPSASGSRQAIGHQTPVAISGLDLNK